MRINPFPRTPGKEVGKLTNILTLTGETPSKFTCKGEYKIKFGKKVSIFHLKCEFKHADQKFRIKRVIC